MTDESWRPDDRRNDAAPAPAADANWVRRLSTGSLTLLGAVLTIGADAPWAKPILEKLRAEAAAAPEPPAPVQNEPPDPRRAGSFADALALLWPTSDWVMRRHLSTIAAALGVPVPVDPTPLSPAPSAPAEAMPPADDSGAAPAAEGPSAPASSPSPPDLAPAPDPVPPPAPSRPVERSTSGAISTSLTHVAPFPIAPAPEPVDAKPKRSWFGAFSSGRR